MPSRKPPANAIAWKEMGRKNTDVVIVLVPGDGITISSVASSGHVSSRVTASDGRVTVRGINWVRADGHSADVTAVLA